MNGIVRVAIVIVTLALVYPVIVLLGGGVAAVDDPIVESHSVATDNARAADVAVTLAAGQLWLGPGARELMDGTFVYSEASRQPRVDYRVVGDMGQLSIDQGNGLGFVAAEDWGNLANVWNIKLNADLPLSLAVTVGAGQSELELADLNLTDVTIRAGAGGTTVNLAGKWDHDVHLSIDGGAGDVTILVPEDGNVDVRAAVGIGHIASSGLAEDAGHLISTGFSANGPALTIDVRGDVGTIQVIAAPVR